MQSLWIPSLSIVHLVVRATLVYFAILLLLRISGKRQVGQMSATEFVTIMLLSNSVQNSMNGGDNSLTGGIVLATVLVALTWIISELSFRYRMVRNVCEGVPTLLIHKGALLENNLHKERITKSDVVTMLRKQGIHSFHEVHVAVLESDGSLSVTKTSDPSAQPV